MILCPLPVVPLSDKTCFRQTENKKQEAKKDVDVVRMDRQALFTDDKYRREAIGIREAGKERQR